MNQRKINVLRRLRRHKKWNRGVPSLVHSEYKLHMMSTIITEMSISHEHGN
jgi:hypothetical protein